MAMILRCFGITMKFGQCACKTRQGLMDAMGVRWCWDNRLTIAGWLQHEAKSRKMWCPLTAAVALLAVAIAVAYVFRSRLADELP